MEHYYEPISPPDNSPIMIQSPEGHPRSPRSPSHPLSPQSPIYEEPVTPLSTPEPEDSLPVQHCPTAYVDITTSVHLDRQYATLSSMQGSCSPTPDAIPPAQPPLAQPPQCVYCATMQNTMAMLAIASDDAVVMDFTCVAAFGRDTFPVHLLVTFLFRKCDMDFSVDIPLQQCCRNRLIVRSSRHTSRRIFRLLTGFLFGGRFADNNATWNLPQQ